MHRISDRGGGIDHDIYEHIWDYGFTTSGNTNGQEQPITNGGMFGEIMEFRAAGAMHGYVNEHGCLPSNMFIGNYKVQSSSFTF